MGNIAVSDAVQSSTVYQAFTKVRDRLPAMIGESQLADLGRYTTNAVTNSIFYRWLTKEPEPEVIVIDLRETWTVGPFITLLDWVIGGLSSAYENSITEQFISGAQRRLHRAPIRYLSLMFLGFLIPASGVLIIMGEQSRVSILGLSILAIVALIGLFIDMSWPKIRKSKPVQLLITALEPPELPERNR